MKYSYTILLFAISLLGRTQGTSEWLDINDARVRFFSNGHIATISDVNSTGYFVPASSNTSPLYSAGLWIGGVDNNGLLRVAAQMYGVGQDLYPGPLTVGGSASITPEISQAYDQIWKVDRSDLILHQQYFLCIQDPNCDPSIEFPNYQIPDEFQTWPVHGDVSADQAYYLAPFYDLDADNVYSPSQGDHPCVPGDQVLYMIFNDNTEPHTGSLGMPIGLEVHMTPFAYSQNYPALDQTIFVHYKLINRSSHTMNDVFVGTFADADIGCANDDFIGTDVSRNMMYFYNWDDFDPTCMFPGYGYDPPAFGIVTLKGPKVDGNGIDDLQDLTLPSYNGRGFNDGVIDNERHGLSRMIYFNREGISTMTDPNQPVHYYNYLQAKWKNGVQMSYGGIGYPIDTTSFIPSHFMYPGDTDTLGVGSNGLPMPPWRENDPGLLIDRRGLASMGPFTLEPGEEDDILIAYVFARAETGGALASVDALKARVDSVRAFAGTIPGIMAPGSPCEQIGVGMVEHDGSGDRLHLYPNPANDMITIGINDEMDALIHIHDVQGKLILRSRSTGARASIDVGSFSSGLHHVQIFTSDRILGGTFMKY